jgi:hypothetical protein
MGSTSHPRLSASEGRKFAFTLAFGFGAIAALFAWRDRPTPATVLLGVATLVLAAGLVVPSRLGPLSRAWTALGAALSRVTSPLFFTLIYMVLVTPIGFLRRNFGRSPLVRASDASSYWVRRPPVDPATQRSAMERQF